MKADPVSKMTMMWTLSMLIFATAALIQPADAQIKKGALVLRSGAANSKANYNGQDTDPNGKLQHVSALCSPDNSNKSKSNSLIASDTTHAANHLFTDNYGATQASTIINAGGNVVSKPLPGNPNHCEISGLTMAKMTSVWAMCNVNRPC
jgi:hypothetical protein